MKIRINRLPALFGALKSLDGPNAAPFRYAAKFTWNRTKDLRILRRELDDLEETGRKILKDITKDSDKPTEEEEKAANQAFFKLQQESVDVGGLLKFKAEDFNLFDPVTNKAGNVIGAAILAELDILTEDLPPEPAEEEDTPPTPPEPAA